MRLFNRFYALCAVAACTILSFAWFLTSRDLSDIVPLASEKFQTAHEFDRRLVVFGDSWSDNKTEKLQGPVWTDLLCSMVWNAPSVGMRMSMLLGAAGIRNAHGLTDNCLLRNLVFLSPGESRGHRQVHAHGQVRRFCR